MAAKTLRKSLSVILIVLGIVFVSLYLFQGILLPFLVGMIVAYVLNPSVSLLEKHKWPRWLASALLILTFFIAVVVLIAVVLPLIKSESLRLITVMPAYLQTVKQEIAPFLADHGYALSSANHATNSELWKWVSHVFANLLSSGWALANLLSLILITPVVAFYMLRDWPKLIKRVDHFWPRSLAPTIRNLFREIDMTLAGFIRGQAAVCFILAVYYTAGLTLVQLNFAPTIGILTGILAFIPYVGAIIGLGLALLVATGQYAAWSAVGAVGIVFALGQVIESQILTPRLVGGRVGLHPVWVIFSLFAGGSLLGFTGVLLAIPCAATFGVMLRSFLQWYTQSAWYIGK